MKITLEYPYSEKWRSGYLVTNPEGRRTVILFNSKVDRSSVAYARYLLAVKLGRFLTSKEQADHIDNDKSNDSLDNLQVLSQSDNLAKSRKPRKLVQFKCPVCAKDFFREPRQSGGRSIRCCSRRCGGIYSSRS